MWACTASVLTARLGCINTQLLGNVVPRWVAEEAGICRSVAAGVEMKSQHADSRPHLMRFLLGSSVLVHCRAGVSQSFHGCHRGHQWNTAFKSIKSERSANTLYGSCAKLSVMHRLPPTENGLNCCKTYLIPILHKAAMQRNCCLDRCHKICNSKKMQVQSRSIIQVCSWKGPDYLYEPLLVLQWNSHCDPAAIQSRSDKN